jgi:hypothetical protein
MPFQLIMHQTAFGLNVVLPPDVSQAQLISPLPPNILKDTNPFEASTR